MYISIGGMPAFDLMEDVEVSLRLTPYSYRLNLGGLLVVSTRRWQKKKFSGYTFQVVKLVSSYLFLRKMGIDMEKVSAKMYKIYYQKA